MSPSAIEPQGLTDTEAAVSADRLSINGVQARRSKTPKIGGGVAAHACSDMFKSPVRKHHGDLHTSCNDD